MLLLNGNTSSMEIDNITVVAFGAYGNETTLGQSVFGPLVGNIILRGSDNSLNDGEGPNKIIFSGMNAIAGKGIQVDGQYNDNIVSDLHFNQIWDQAPTTPAIFFTGFGNGNAIDIEISEIVCDSENAVIVGNFGGITSLILSNCYTTAMLVSGLPIQGLEVSGAQTTTVGQTFLANNLNYGSGNVGSIAYSSPPNIVTDTKEIPISLGARGAIFAPVNPAVANITATASGVGTIPEGTWPVVVTFVGWDGGESAPSDPVYVTVNGSQGVEVSWTFARGYAGAFVYIDTFRNSDVPFTSSPQTITSRGIFESQPEIDGTGLPLINDGGIITQQLILSVGGAPATSSSTGMPGQIGWDGTHIYLCVAVNTWVRATLATF